MNLSTLFQTTFRTWMLIVATLSSLSVSAKVYEFQFADLSKTWGDGRIFRASYHVIISDVKDSDEFELTVQTKYNDTAETTYKGLKLNTYSAEKDKQFITFENDKYYFTFIKVMEGEGYVGEEFRIITKDKDLSLAVQYSNKAFVHEDYDAAYALMGHYDLLFRDLLEDIQKNNKIQKNTQHVTQNKKPTPAKPKSSAASTQKSDWDYDAWLVSAYLENPMGFSNYPLDPNGFYSFANEKFKTMYMSLHGSYEFSMSLDNVAIIFGKGCWFFYYFNRDKERWEYRISFDNVSQANDFVTKIFIPRLAKQDIKFSPAKKKSSYITARYEAVYSSNDITVDIISYDSDADVNIEVTREFADLDPSLPSLVRSMSIKELLLHPFGLENNTLDSLFDSIIAELRKNRYAISETSYAKSKQRVLETPAFGVNMPSSAPIVQFPLQMGNTTVKLSSDKYILAYNGARYTYNIAIPVDLPDGTYEQSKKYREEVFRNLVECLKREGYPMKKASKGLWFHFDKNDSNIKKAFIGQKGDKTVLVGLGIYNDIYLSVVYPHKE